MREREEIENDFLNPIFESPTGSSAKFILEVLLDIRDLLETMNHNVSQLEGKICRNL